MATSTSDGTLLQRIAGKLPYLPGALRQVAEYVLEKPDAARSMSITALAADVGVAESTVSRFVREMGLGGYSALRLGLAEASFVNRAQESAAPDRFVYEGIAQDDGLAEIVGKIRRSSAQSLDQTAGRLDPDALDRAVGAIEAAETVVFLCMGASSIAAEEGVMRFTRAGKKCLLFRDHSLQAMVATIIGPRDVVIAISSSGHSTPVVDGVRRARERGAGTVAVTAGVDSPLAAASATSLFTTSVPAGGVLYGEDVTAKWGQILVIDVLYAAYAARHVDATVSHLEATYRAGIERSRSS